MFKSTQPKCDNANSLKDSFKHLLNGCPQCGADTCPHYLYCKKCGHQLRNKPMFCQCGNKLSSRDNYCDQCGRRT